MSFPRYPKYKDSGVEWLGEVPEHWDVLSLGKITVAKCDGPFGSGLKSEHYTEEGVRVIRLQNIRRDGFDGSDSAFIDETYYREQLRDHDVQSGDIIIAGLGDERNTVGRACVAPQGIEPAMVKADCFRFRVNTKRALAEFAAAQLTSSSISDAGVLSSGSTRSRIPLSIMASRKLALPPTGEQIVIAAFLDRETAKIDELVAEQRRLIELLKEKRQAVISHAVTKGLNPNVPLRPSGIEWLGDVPEHWEVVPLKHLCALLKDGTHLPPARVEDGVPLLSVRNVVDGGFVFRDDDSMISEASYQELCRAFMPQAGDVLLAIVGATLGKTAVISEGLGHFHIQRSLAIFRTFPDEMLPVFLNLVFQSHPFQSLLWELVGYSAQPGIYLGTLQNLRIPVPPVAEQERILEIISVRVGELRDLITEAERGIYLLQERRTALISAAVTGKIDVRKSFEEVAIR